jgi:hypothetical protein
MGLLGILVGLGFLIWLAFRGGSVLLPAPAAALIAALFAGEPPLASIARNAFLSERALDRLVIDGDDRHCGCDAGSSRL